MEAVNPVDLTPWEGLKLILEENFKSGTATRIRIVNTNRMVIRDQLWEVMSHIQGELWDIRGGLKE